MHLQRMLMLRAGVVPGICVLYQCSTVDSRQKPQCVSGKDVAGVAGGRRDAFNRSIQSSSTKNYEP